MMYVSVGRRALEAQTRAKTRVRGIEPTEDQIKKARGLRPRNKRHATAVERVAQRRFIMEVLRACVRDQLACPSNADLDARCRAAGHGGMTPENTLGQLARDGVIARVELYCGHKRVIELLDGSRTRPPPELSPPHKVIHGPRGVRP